MVFSDTTAVIGCQWGDEGKGKIVDYLTQQADLVVRFQGGHNAGHTLVIEGTKYVLHLLPSGIMHPQVQCVIGNGVVLSLPDLLKEIDQMTAKGVDIGKRLFISQHCPLLLPYHVAVDQAREQKLNQHAIGTTGRGIGPAYEDKVARRGLRVIDLLLDPAVLKSRLQRLAEYHNFILTQYYQASAIDADEVFNELVNCAAKIRPWITDVTQFLADQRKAQKRIVFEGAQGVALDIDHGTYPYVTSSNTVVSGIGAGCGLPASALGQVIGVFKAYVTRVGGGPFPTELHDDVGASIAKWGHEFGSTTGRPRRCGWFDAPLARRAVQINGITHLCITKLDVLDHLDTLEMCVAYKYQGRVVDSLAMDDYSLSQCEPVYKRFEGWCCSTQSAKRIEDLPEQAQHYLQYLSEALGLPILMISTGVGREDLILNDEATVIAD